MIYITKPIFCPNFDTIPVNSAIPPERKDFENLCELVEEYEQFCKKCERWGQIPANVFVYYNEDDEDKEFFPDYPDLIIEWDSEEENAVVQIA